MITDAELVTWGDDANEGRHETLAAARILALIAEVRRRRAEADVMREEIVQRRRFSLSPWAQHG